MNDFSSKGFASPKNNEYNNYNAQVYYHWCKMLYVYLYNKLSYAHILIGFHLWSIGGQMYKWHYY